MVKVSVIVPVFNLEKYIEQTIISILKQTLQEIEIIIVDDGSTDSSYEICTRFTQQDSRISLYRQENDGAPGKARNVGLSKAQGETVIFFDGDDIMHPTMLEEMYLSLKASQADAAICNFEMIDEEHNKVGQANIAEIKKKISKDHRAYFDLWPFPCNKLYSTVFLRNTKVLFLEKVFGQDLGFYYSILAHEPNVTLIEKTLLSYLVREGSITKNKKTRKKHADIVPVFKQIYSEFAKIGKLEKYNDVLNAKLLAKLLFKSEYFVFDEDQQYLNMLVDYLHEIDPNWDKDNQHYYTLSTVEKIYYKMLFKYRLYRLLGFYKRVKGKRVNS